MLSISPHPALQMYSCLPHGWTNSENPKASLLPVPRSSTGNLREGWKLHAGQPADGYNSNPESPRRPYVRPRQQARCQDDGTNGNIDSDLEEESIAIYRVKSDRENTDRRKISASITTIRKQTTKKVLPTLGQLDIVDYEQGRRNSTSSSDDSGELT